MSNEIDQLYHSICKKIERGAIEIAQLNFNRNQEDDFVKIAKDYFADKECKTADSYYLRGRSKLANSDFEGAIEDFDECFKIGSRTLVFGHRGIAKYGLKDYHGALRDFNYVTLFANRYDDPLLYYMRGCAKVELESFESAIGDFDKVIELEPKNADAYNSRARANGYIGMDTGSVKNIKKAIVDHKKAIKLDPTEAIYYVNLSETYGVIEDTENAEEYMKKAKELGFIE